jgi:hypothetical protein
VGSRALRFCSTKAVYFGQATRYEKYVGARVPFTGILARERSYELARDCGLRRVTDESLGI